MKVTSVSVQARDKNRVNIAVDGKYSFSLDIAQLVELEIKKGNEYSEEEIEAFQDQSLFGKVYSRALEYCLSRPHSEKEVRDYLYKKTVDRKIADGGIKRGVSGAITSRVLERLINKGYVDDAKFTKFWIENRNQRKGISKRKLSYELQVKGVAQSIIADALGLSERSDDEEIKKIIEKKLSKYDDKNKLMAYLARQGFSYDDIVKALKDIDD